MNILFSKGEQSSGISISKVDKKDAAPMKRAERCALCLKRENELNEVVYMKSQIESKHNEAVCSLNVQLKVNEDNKKNFLLLNEANCKLKEDFSLKQHEVNQLETIIQSLKERLKEIPQLPIRDFEPDNRSATTDEAFNLKVKQQYEAYGKRICALELDSSSLLIDNSKQKKHIEMLKLVNVKLTAELSKLIEENKELLLTQRQLRIDNEALVIKSTSNEANCIELQKKLQCKSQSEGKLNEELKVMKTNNGNMNSLASLLKDENDRVKAQWLEMQKEKEEELALSNFNKQSTLEANVSSLSDENRLLFEENMQLRSSLNDYRQRIELLTLSNRQLEAEKGDIEKLTAVVILLRKQLEAQEEDIVRLSAQNGFLKAQYHTKPRLDIGQEFEQMYKPKDRNDCLIDGLSLQFAKLEGENRKLSSVTEELKKVLIDKEDMIKALNIKLTNIQSSASEREINSMTLQDMTCELNKQIIQLKLTSTDLNERNIKLEAEKEELNSKLKLGKEALDSNDRAKQSLQSINNSKEQIILNLNNELLLKEKLLEEKDEIVFEQGKAIEEFKEKIFAIEKDKDKLLKIIHKKHL